MVDSTSIDHETTLMMAAIILDTSIRSPFILLTNHRRGKPTPEILEYHRQKQDTAYLRYWQPVQGIYVIVEELHQAIEDNNQAWLHQCLPQIRNVTTLQRLAHR